MMPRDGAGSSARHGSSPRCRVTRTSPCARRPDERIEAMMWRKMAEPPPALPASVPAPLARLLQQCLAPTPAQRPTLEAVAAELLRLDVTAAALGLAADVVRAGH